MATRDTCIACNRRFNNPNGHKYCPKCDPKNFDYREKVEFLLDVKKDVQVLEDKQKKSRELWMKYASETKRLGQEIGTKKQILFDAI